MKYVHSPADIPDKKHWAALVFGTIHIPGDERSRSHPGHGYPASTETKIDYIAFDDKEEAEKWVSQREGAKYSYDPYKLIEVESRSVQTSVKII